MSSRPEPSSASPDRAGGFVVIAKRLMANSLFGLLMLLQLVMPADFVSWFIVPASRIFYAAAPKTRAAMFDNARHLLGPGASLARQEALVRAMMTSWCRFIVDLFRFQRVSRRKLLEARPRFEGIEAYHEARQARRGAILVTAHLGNWEYGAVLLQHLNEVPNVVFQPDPNVVLRRIFSFQRAVKEVREVRIEGDPFVWLELRAALQRDEVVLIQGDRSIGGAGRVERFLGGRARFPDGPIKLAIASGAPLIPVFVLRDDQRLCIRIREPIFPDAPGVTEDDLARHVVRCIEDVVRRHPEQWLMPQRFWLDPADDGDGSARLDT